MTEPPILYHYTDAKGLIGIVDKQVLWATDAEFLNDAQELRYGRAEMRKALLARADELGPPGTEGSADDSRATVMRSAADHLEPGGEFARMQYHSAYVACFCEDGDLLSQWRAYGAAGGYAIGFHTSALREIPPLDVRPPIGEGIDPEELEGLKPEPLPVRLVQVRYGSPAVESAIATVLREVAPEPVGFPGVQGFHKARTVVIPELAEVKHPAFSEEREWRLIVVGSIGEEAVSFRTGSLGVIPYVELDLPAGVIAEVVVGPGREPPLRHHDVERLINERRLDDVQIRHSAAPFRG
jgi:Protein of unknown function (DUF2971)